MQRLRRFRILPMDEQNEGNVQVLQSINEIKASADVVKENSNVLLNGGKQIGE